jgi:HK97 family phage portal protein
MSWWGNVWAAVQGKELRLTDGDLYRGLGGLAGEDSWAGERVTSNQAMQLSAYWACTKLISQVIASLPVGIYEKAADGQKIARPDHPLYELLHNSPNADRTAMEFWEGRVLGLCTGGNGFAEKVMRGERISSLNPLPADTWVRREPDGTLSYTYYDLIARRQETLPASRVWHIRGFGDGDMGLSPVGYARQALGIALATDRAAGQTFGKGMRAKGFFTMPGKLTPEQRVDAQKALVDPYMGPEGKWAGVLEMGVDFKSVNISPKDAELIMSRQFNVEDVCRWHGVPPVLVGHNAQGQTMWGSGIEQVLLGWLTLQLRPYLTRIEQSAKKALLLPSERSSLSIEFNIDGLLRADSAARADFYSKLFQLGAMSPNMIADKENLARFDGGDARFVNSTFTPIDQAGQTPAPPLVRTS